MQLFDSSVDPNTLGDDTPIPLLRSGLHHFETSLPALDGTTSVVHYLVDNRAGTRLVMSREQSVVYECLRGFCWKGGGSLGGLRELVGRFGVTLDNSQLLEHLRLFDSLAMFLGEEMDDEALRQRHWQARRDAHVQHKLQALRRSLDTAAADVPFYQATLGEKPGARINSYEDLLSLPILMKEDVRTRLNDLQPTWKDGSVPTSVWSSSGSTGKRTQALHLPGEDFDGHHLWLGAAGSVDTARFNYRLGFMGTPVCSGMECHMDMRLPYEKRLWPSRSILILNTIRDPSCVPEGYADEILADLTRFGAEFMVADLSYLVPVARHIRDKGLTPPPLKFIMGAFELVHTGHKNVVAEVFGCPVYDMIGIAECGFTATSCDAGNIHVADTKIIEILVGDRPARPGEPGRVVVTTLNQLLGPMIRYEVGDLAMPAAGPCSCIHNHGDIYASNHGAMRDVVTDGQGRPVTSRMVDEVMASDELWRQVGNFSLCQSEEKTYRLIFSPEIGYVADRTESTIRDKLHDQLLGADVELSIRKRRSVPPGHNGKHRLCYQEDPPVDPATYFRTGE